MSNSNDTQNNERITECKHELIDYIYNRPHIISGSDTSQLSLINLLLEKITYIINFIYNFTFYWYVKINIYIKNLTNGYPNIHLFLRNKLLSRESVKFLKMYYDIQSTDILFESSESNVLLDEEVSLLYEYKYKNSHMIINTHAINKDKSSLLESLITDLCINDMKKKNMILDLNTQTIEYWINANHYNIHVDCDSLLLKTENIFNQGIHNGLIYMTDSDEPTYISEYVLEDETLNKINNADTSFFLHFPKKLNNLSFNGQCFHGAIQMFETKNIDRTVVSYNVWENKNKPEMNESIFKENIVNMNDHNKAFIENNNIMEHSLYSRLDNFEVINKRNSEEIKNYAKYVLEQTNSKQIKLHLFSTPYSRVELYDIIGPLYIEHRDIVNNYNNKKTPNILRQIICHSKTLDVDFCNNLIQCAENYAGKKEWPLIHNQYKSNSIRLEKLPNFEEMLYIFEKIFIPLLSSTYKNSSVEWNILDMFINKYDILDNASGLSQHTDAGIITINVLLNDENEFEGGGTRFIKNNEIIKLHQGDALFHCGKDMHEGIKITKGTRYVLVIVLDILIEL
tara:strand:- start:2492 stop:4195 length:1704 start_codon:yes stop_codon:yes gene_type:complete